MCKRRIDPSLLAPEGRNVSSMNNRKRFQLRQERHKLNQEQHHAYKTFREEYVDLLKEYEIAFENAYLFDEITPHYL